MTAAAPHPASPRSIRLQKAACAVLVVLMTAALATVVLEVDLTPRVESDFFFSTEDPAFQATARIGELFPTRPQLVLSALAPDVRDREYFERVRALSDELLGLEGIVDLWSLTHGPATPESVPQSPLWGRLLLSENPRSTYLIASLEEGTGGELVARVEEIVERHRRPSFQLSASGVPYVVELIRRHLMRDLRVFSGAAFLVFGLVIALLYRSWRLVAGTLLSCLGACLLTLTVLHLLGTPIGVLTANIATIVFVLTLSHTVFLTANWRRVRPGLTADTAMAEGVRITFAASFWCMVAALLGFGSLFLASAKPLRELGTSGVTGTAVAIVVAYGFYPLFLRSAHAETRSRPAPAAIQPARLPGAAGPAVVAAVVLAGALGLPATNTDPSLLTYFAEGSELRSGLELIDQGGGSSPLYLVLTDPAGRRMDSAQLDPVLARVQESIESEASVGGALSLAVLLAEARKVPFAAFLGPERLVAILSGEQFGNVAASFVTEDRSRALFLLRMRETGRTEERREVVARLLAAVEEEGLEVELAGGLYDLQGQLGELVSASLVRELGGLLLFFVFVAAAVARTGRAAAAMVACLAAVPVLLLGMVAHLGRPVDVISAPGANVAISLGIDAMIHLMMAVRRRRRAGDGQRDAWAVAVGQMRQPIVGAMLILATGFGIFVLSSFPPTQRFGTVVAAGTLVSAVMALVVLPFLVTGGRRAAAGAAPADSRTS